MKTADLRAHNAVVSSRELTRCELVDLVFSQYLNSLNVISLVLKSYNSKCISWWGVPSSNVIILGAEKFENHWIRHSNDIQQALIPCKSAS